jgi:hypothetical protein
MHKAATIQRRRRNVQDVAAIDDARTLAALMNFVERLAACPALDRDGRLFGIEADQFDGLAAVNAIDECEAAIRMQ